MRPRPARDAAASALGAAPARGRTGGAAQVQVPVGEAAAVRAQRRAAEVGERGRRRLAALDRGRRRARGLQRGLDALAHVLAVQPRLAQRLERQQPAPVRVRPSLSWPARSAAAALARTG